MRPRYPWSAVVGQESLKRALLLSAIDPAIGGVLLSGPRGVAKTTLSRALAALIEGAFVELPLGATEERVTGTLDLSVALREGHVQFSPGLLARAHAGALYVDEVNLLPDALVDLLLDAAASGQNVVERDGVSHVHPARFVLIGTMNPEEGELRPQLTDRFGLAVVADAEIAPSERAEIVTRRLAFEDDPAAFVAQYDQAQAALVARCRRARERIVQIPLAGPALARVTEHCYAARVDGLRADLAMLRAARAHAAWHDRDAITDADVDAVAELALAHRRRARPSPPRGGAGGSAPPSGARGSGTPSTDQPPGGGSARASTPREPSEPSASPAGNRGALAPVAVASASAPTLPSWLVGERGGHGEARRRGAVSRAQTVRGRRGASPPRAGRIDWFRSLARRRGPKLTLGDLSFQTRRGPTRKLWVVALDCSTSMLRSGALAAAKGVAHALEARALRDGAHLALITFRGAHAEVALTPEARSQARARAIDALGAGGGTPLRAALVEALALCDSRPFRHHDVDKRIILLTDGRTREQLDDFGVRIARCDALSVTVIDCERGRVRLGRAPALASALSGQSVHVDALNSHS